MKAERILEVVELLQDELNSHRVLKLLDALAERLGAGDASAAKPTLEKIISILDGSPSDRLAPSRWLIVKSIGGANLVGIGLRRRLTALVDDYRLNPGEMAPLVAQIKTEILDFEGVLNNFASFSSRLSIKSIPIPDGHCEVGILFPFPGAIATLEDLAATAGELDAHLRPFGEVGGETGSLPLYQLSTCDLQVFLLTFAATGAAVAKAIEKILDIYKKKLEIQSIRLDIERKQIDNEVALLLKAREEDVVAQGVKAAASAVVELYAVDDPGRRNELTMSAERSIRFMMTQIDRGIVFEVTPAPRTSDGRPLDDPKGSPKSPEARQLTLARELGPCMTQIAAQRVLEALPAPSPAKEEGDA